MKKIVVLDRDGVINQDSPNYIKSADEWLPLPGAIEAIARLKAAGYWVAIATNQSGLGRGYYSVAELDAMHAKMAALLAEYDQALDFIAYCPHLPTDNCDCRKPLPGLLNQIEAVAPAPLAGALMVGDSVKDMQVGAAKAMNLALVRTGNGLNSEQHDSLPPNVTVYDDLASCVNSLTAKTV